MDISQTMGPAAHWKCSLCKSRQGLTSLPVQGLWPVGQDHSAALGTGLDDIVTHPGFWVEGAGEVQGCAVCYLRQLTERGLLDTACRQESSGGEALGGLWASNLHL